MIFNMKRNLIYVILLTQSLILSANELNPIMNQNSHNKEYQINKSSEIVKCNVVTENITFTHAINGADTCVNVLDNGALSFLCKEGLDFFCDPNGGELSNNTLPILLLPVNNTQPFTLTAKVTPEFSSEGLYNAADLLDRKSVV